MDTLLPPSLSGLATIPERGAPPKTRVPNAAAARKLSDILKQEDSIPAYSRKLVNGLCGGAPPFSTVSPDMAWIPNVNFQEMAAMLEGARVPYYQLLNVETFIEFKTNFQPDHPDVEKWNRIAATKFHDMVKRWPDWEWEFQGKDYEMLKHGKGPVMFEDYPDWRFRSLDSGAVKVPKESNSCVNKRIPYLDLFTQERAHTLWIKIMDESAATAKGWNVPNVRNAIMHAMKGQGSLQSWDYYENILQTQDLTASYSSGDIIECVTKLVVEFDGKISKLIYTDGAFSTPERLPDDNNGFLFADIGKYDDYTECLIVFFQEIGDTRKWVSVKGLGGKAFKYLWIKNQMNCRMLAAVEMASGLTVQVSDTKSKDAMQLTQRAMVTYIPPGVKVIQNAQPSGFMDGPITAMRVLDNQMAANLGQSSARSLAREDGKGEQPTATQVNKQTSRDSSLNQGQISMHFTPLDELVNQMFIRAATKGTSDKEAKRFQQECVDAGCPLEALQDVAYVRWNRLAGYGSSEIRDLNNQRMLESGAVAAMPSTGQQNFWRNFTGSTMGADKVEAYYPNQHIPNEDDSIAAMENAMVAMGRPPVISSGQDDMIHCQSHLQDADQTLKPVSDAIDQGQKDPQQLQSALQYVQLMGPHLEEHIARLQQDKYRKKEAKLFQDKLNQVVAFNGKLHGAIRDAQRQQSIAAQQQSQATALGVLDQAKLQSQQTHDQLASMKAKADMNRKDAKTANDLRLKTIATLNAVHLDRVKAAAKPASNGNGSN